VEETAHIASADARSGRVRRLVLRAVLALLGVALIVPPVAIRLSTRGAIRRLESIKPGSADIALILGAGLQADGTPSDVLAARVRVGVTLYKHCAVRKLIMSGDNSRREYDEVSAMKALAVQMGVRADDVLLDYAGFNTMQSCVRLRKVFGQSQGVVVSQRFHLPRAVHLCRFAGIRTIAVQAPDPRSRLDGWKSTIREVPATTLAWWSVHVFGVQPKFLGPKIDIDHPSPEALQQPLA
jgi:vancomycin permeability regulator SanA